MSRGEKIQLAKFARLQHRLAELKAEEASLIAECASIFEAFATGEGVDLTTGRRVHRVHVPALPPVNELDQKRAQQALLTAERRRRVRQ